MITSVKFCLSYDLIKVILSHSRIVISMKICIVIMDVAMTLLVPDESVM